jgi:hypothetical protein
MHTTGEECNPAEPAVPLPHHAQVQQWWDQQHPEALEQARLLKPPASDQGYRAQVSHPAQNCSFFDPPNQGPHTQLLQNNCPATMPIVGTAPSSEHCSHNKPPSSGQNLPGRDGDGDAQAHSRSGRMTCTRVAHLTYRHPASHATKPTPYPTLAEEAPG